MVELIFNNHASYDLRQNTFSIGMSRVILSCSNITERNLKKLSVLSIDDDK